MPSSDSRSHSGCWTCRVRRKKCDEGAFPCKTCDGLHLLCHGYGPRPEWMDGGTKEYAKVLEFKTAVRQNLKQRRRSKSFKQSETSSEDVVSVPKANPRTESHIGPFYTPMTSTDDAEVTCATLSLFTNQAVHPTDEYFSTGRPLSCDVDLSPLDDLSWDSALDGIASGQIGQSEILLTPVSAGAEALFPDEYPSCSPVHALNQSASESTLHALDIPNLNHDIVRQYFRHIYPSQFPFANDEDTDQVMRQLRMLSSQSRPCRAALATCDVERRISSLAALGLMLSTDARRQARAYQQEVQACLDRVVANESLEGPHGREQRHLLEAEICAAQLIFSKVAGGDSTWADQVKTLAAIPPFNYQKVPDADYLETMRSLPICLDILASTTTGQSPSFALCHFERYERTQGITCDLAAVTGCDTTVMTCIMHIAEMQARKLKSISGGALSLLELARRALQLESDVMQARRDNIRHLDKLNLGPSSRENDMHIVTNVFACAAMVYLHTIVSGAQPQVPEIKKGVEETMEALRSISRIELVKSMTWPICVAACMADSDSRQFFDCFERGVVEEFGRNHRVLRAFSIARECWRLRDRSASSGKTCDWRDGMASLGTLVVLI